MIVTKRDQRVLDFLLEYKVATTNTIAELFYPSLRVAQRRLKLMYDHKFIRRDRSHFTAQYYYYIKKPRQLRHNMLLTDFYREMNRFTNIKLFEKEFEIENIRADGLIAYEFNNKNYIAFIEVQISNMPLNVKKYEHLYSSKKYKKYFPVFPMIFAICNKRVPSTDLKIIQVREDLLDLFINL